ncbi:hypothetical protein [Streptomyces sp. NPDC047042]|uniref:hypothetical protein n=1 Tax=Streptomyces sp. NPDC047042 TaxID=3154807 RepID=UPI0033D39F5F
MNPTETAAAGARSHARIAASVAVLLILSPFAARLLALVSPLPAVASMICALIGGTTGFLLLSEQCRETGLVHCSMTRVTARTPTGERSVDLKRVRDVRLLTSFSYNGPSHTVVVRDGDGVRLGLTSAKSQRALVRALQSAGDEARGGPHVTAAARAHLRLA